MKRKRITLVLLLLILISVLCACENKEKNQLHSEKSINIYYLNKETTKVVMKEYPIKQETTEALLPEVIGILSTQPDDVELKAPISKEFGMLNYSIEESQLVLNFDVRYLEMEPTEEILTRAALVRTLTQIPGIKYVSITIENEPLQDTAGNPVGTMTTDMFIDNAGTEINSYEKVKLHLYFANETGDGLIEVNRTIVYNSNISLEKLVVEQIITGPSNDETNPTTNPETKIISVTVKDGVCYVNVDESYLTQPYQVSSDVTIYSLVNSLVELSNVNKVQISINGKTDIMYREKISLTKFFERNLELMQ